MNINNSTNIYNLYNTFYQNSMSLYSSKLSRKYSPVNKAQAQDDFSSGSLKYVTSLKSSSKDVTAALKQLTGGQAFSKNAVASSNSNVLSVQSKSAEIDMPLSVNVDKIASNQTNEGSQLRENATFGGSGTNKFSVEVDGKTTQFSVNVSVGDTNKDVQQKMANAINKAGIGIKATVETNADDNTSTLRLESTNTGNKSAFTIADTDGTLVAKTGVGNVTRQAQNALYRINGGDQRESESNSVDLGNGISATLNKSSDEAVTISSGMDKDFVSSAIEELVNSFNSLYSTAADKSDDPKAAKLVTKMSGISKSYSNVLSRLGVESDKDGTLTINQEKLNNAIDDKRLLRYFADSDRKNYGFAAQLGKLANSVANSTSNYVSKSITGSSLTENFSYGNRGNIQQYSYFNTGWLFDYSY